MGIISIRFKVGACFSNGSTVDSFGYSREQEGKACVCVCVCVYDHEMI